MTYLVLRQSESRLSYGSRSSHIGRPLGTALRRCGIAVVVVVVGGGGAGGGGGGGGGGGELPFERRLGDDVSSA